MALHGLALVARLVLGVAPGTPRLLAWQAWHFVTSTFTLRGRHGTYGTGLALVARLVPGVAPGFRRRGCWRGSRGTWRHPPSFHVAGMVLGDMTSTLAWQAWQAWHLWHWAGSGGALGHRGTWHHLHFVWQAWHFVTWIVTLRGRRGTYGTGLALVARLVSGGTGLALVARLVLGVAPGTPRLLAWQPWHLETSTFVSRGRRGTWWHRLLLWRGRRGTYGTGLALVARLVLGVAPGTSRLLAWQPWQRRHPPSYHVAGVALRDIYLHFLWQAWHFVSWIVTLRGRRGTYGTGLALVARLVGVAAVALRDIYLHFVWEAWHFVTWIVTLRGRRGTYGTGLALVARLVLGVAPGTPRLLAWQAWHFVTSTFTLCGRRGTSWHGLLLCVAGVALMALGWLWWRAWDAAAVGVAAVALGDIHLRFTWQAWYLVTSTSTLAWQAWHLWHWAVTSTFTLCGRRGTSWHGLLLCVAGVALVARLVLGVAPGAPRLLAWQPWHLETSTFVSRGKRGTSWHLPCHHTSCLHTHNLSSHYLSTHNLSTCHHTTCVFTLLVHTQLTHTQLVIRPLLITPLVITPLVFTLLVFTLLVFTLLVHRAPAHRQSQAASVSAVCAAASSVAVVTCQVCGMLAVGLKCHMSWTPTAVKGCELE